MAAPLPRTGRDLLRPGAWAVAAAAHAAVLAALLAGGRPEGAPPVTIAMAVLVPELPAEPVQALPPSAAAASAAPVPADLPAIPPATVDVPTAEEAPSPPLMAAEPAPAPAPALPPPPLPERATPDAMPELPRSPPRVVRPAAPHPPPRPRPAPRPASAVPEVAPSPYAVPGAPSAASPAALPAAPAPAAASHAAAPAAAATPGWMGQMSAWLQRNHRYPDAARSRNEQGTVLVRFTVNRGGQVVSVTLVQGSGSDTLDEAALAMLRGGTVPAFPSDMPQAQQTVTVPVRYRLVQ